MTPMTMLRFLGRAMAVVALVSSGVYVLVYLWRWEWNRALITGMLFLATLIVVTTWVVMRAITRLSERMARLEEAAVGPVDVGGTLRRANAGHAGRHFEWLRESSGRTSVFVPILLGAGALLSGLAYVIERLAGAVGGPAVDHRTTQGLTVDLPLRSSAPTPVTVRTALPDPSVPGTPARGLLAGSPAGTGPPGGHSDGGPSGARAVGRSLVALGGVAVILGVSIVMLRESTQTRPDVVPAGGSTTLVLEISQRRLVREPADLAHSLWSACRTRVPPSVDLASVRPSGGDRATIVLDRAIGRHGERRLVGCLEDATLERVQADVVAFRSG